MSYPEEGNRKWKSPLETAIHADDEAERQRALAAEATLSFAIDSEEARALAAEAILQAEIDSGGGGGGAVSSVDGHVGVVDLSTTYQPLASRLTTLAGTTDTGTGALVRGTSPAITTPTGIVKGDVGLGSVDNTADTAKPVSTAQQTALNLKANLASPTFSGTVTIPTGASITAPTGIVKGDVGLGNVDNTSDANKPVSSATTTALAGKQALDTELTALAGLTSAADTAPYFTGSGAAALTALPFAGRNIAAGNVWRSSRNLGLRAALGNSRGAPAKIALITDSEGEVAAFVGFASDLMARYPGTAPTLVRGYGGFNASYGFAAWSTTGSVVQGAGATGRYCSLTSGQTLDLSFYGDGKRIHFISNTGTFNVTIDGATTSGMSTATASVAITTASSTTITSSALFTTAMVGLAITGTGIPTDTYITAVGSTSSATISKAATASGSITASIGNSWTSPALVMGNHTVTVTGASGTVKIDGDFSYVGNSTAGVQVHLLAHTSWTTADMLALSGGPAPTGNVTVGSTALQDYLTQEGMHAVVHETAINDTATATYNTNMDALLTKTAASLPNATLAIFLPEPKATKTWMSALPPVAQALATSHGALLADMNVIANDHSAQSGGSPDTPYGLTYDGVHYTTTGARLSTQLLLDVLDPAPPSTAFWEFTTPSNSGVVAPFWDATAQTLALGVWTDVANGNPAAAMGYIGTLLAAGFFAGDPTATSFTPDTYLFRNAAGVWTTGGGSIKTNWFHDGTTTDTRRVGNYYLAGATPASTAVGGHAVFDTTTATVPAVMLGYINALSATGLFGGDGGSSAFDTYFLRNTVGVWSLVGGKITGSTTTITANTDLIPRGYVDPIAHKPVKYVTNQAALLACTYANGTLGVGATLTGNANGALSVDANTTWSVNDRVAINDQVSTFQNGIYVVTQIGDAGTPFILTRSLSFDQASEITVGSRIMVTAGTYANSEIVVTAAPTTMGTDPIAFQAQIFGSALLSSFNVLGAPFLSFIDSTISRPSANKLSLNASAGVAVGGDLTLTDAKNIITGTTTGMKIGTASGQKLGFFNATPVVQQLATADLGTALSTLGLRAAGTAYPITTSGAVALTGAVAVTDSQFSIKDNSDATKIVQFEAASITTGTTRTFTAPDQSGPIAIGIPFGRTKHAGTTDYSVPGVVITATSTLALSANVDVYAFILLPTAVTVDQLACNVVTAQSGAANLRMGIYAADTDWQPSGAALIDSGSIAVANAFTGAKTFSTSTVLPAGRYLTVVNCDVAITGLRTFRGFPAIGAIDSTLAGPCCSGATIARTYAAFPNPGSAWTTSTQVGEHPVVLRISVP